MEHETNAEIRIICDEVRKVSRTALVLEAWSEHPRVSLAIEQHNLTTDARSRVELEVYPTQLIAALQSVMGVMPEMEQK